MEELMPQGTPGVAIEGAGLPILERGEGFLPPPGEEISYGEAALRGIQENHIVPLVTQAPTTVDDPNWWWDESRISDLNTRLADETLVNYVMKARSQEEYDARLQLAESRKDTVKQLGEAGWDKTAAYVLAGVFDPTEIAAVTALTAGVGAIPERLVAAYKGYKMVDKIKDAAKMRQYTDWATRAGYGAVEGAAYAAIFEGIRAAYQPDADASNLPLYMAFGAALGGTIEGGAAAYGKIKRMSAYDKRVASGIPLLPEEEELFADIIQDRSMGTILKNMDRSTPEGGGGVAAEAFDANNLDKYANAPEQRGIGLLGLRRVISSVARAMQSEEGAIRTLAQKFGLNSAGNTDGSAVPVGALEYQAWAQASSTGRFLNVLHPARDSWISETYGSVMNPIKRREYEMEFNKMVTKAIRRPAGTYDSRVEQAAKTMRDEFAYLFNEAKASKARGFMERDATADYAPRIFDEVNIDKLIRQHGRERVVELVSKAIKSKQTGIDDNILGEIADGYVKGIEGRIAGIGRDGLVVRMGVREDTLDDIREALMKKYGDEAKVDEIVNSFERSIAKPVKGEGVARARARVDLDETVSIDLGDGSKLDFEDLLINDAEDLHQMYTFQVGGAVGLARNGLEQEGMESIERIFDKIREQAYKKGINRDRVDDEIQALKFMYDGLTGQLAHQQGIGRGSEIFLRRVREFNFIRTMGQSGMASLAEVANVVFEHNVKSIMKGLPRLKDMISKMKSGQLEDDLYRELQQYTGLGTDMITGRVRTGYDVNETEFIASDYKRADAVLAYFRNKTAVLSGMLPLTAMMRRADSMFYALDWHNAAQAFSKNGKYKAPFSKIKMEQMGINEEMGTLISKMISKHATVDKKGKLIALNLKDWGKEGADGKRAADAFSQSAYRHATQGVQETNLGSVNRFFRTPIGKTVGQFLSFVLGSQEQQFQRLLVRAKHGDGAAVGVILSTSAFVATLVYIARAHLSESGKSDELRAKNLEKKLDPANVILDGTLNYMGALSIFMTARSQFSNNSIISNPTIGLFQTLSGFGNDALFSEKDMSEAKIRKYLGLLPMQNWYPMVTPLNMFAAEMAE